MNRLNKIKLASNFFLYEFQSPDTKEVIIFQGLIPKLQLARDLAGKALIITSGYRTEKHNALVKGQPKSQHRIGAAADISTLNHDAKKLKKILIEVGFLQVILYAKANFIHAALFKKNPLL